jgi:hypothetical protein
MIKNATVLGRELKDSAVNLDEKRVAATYQNKGTWRVAQQIVQNRGFFALYAGFRLQLGKSIQQLTFSKS